MPQIILGIDPGIGRTGYAFLQKKQGATYHLLDCGCVTTPTDLATYRRLKQLSDRLNILIKKFRPQIMVIEKLFFNTNAKTAIMVGQAMGTIMLVGAQNRLTIHEVTPLQVKTALTGYGRAAKQQVKKMVFATLDLKNKTIRYDDTTDAIAVALCFCLRNPRLIVSP